jgi:hypothetical protein
VPPPTPQDLILARLRGALNGGVFERFEHPWNANLRLQATPLENPGSCARCYEPTPPIGGHGGTQVPKQLRKLNININQELFLSWWDDMAIVWQFGMVMVRMSSKHLAERGRRVAWIGSCPFWQGYRQSCEIITWTLAGNVYDFPISWKSAGSQGYIFSNRPTALP